VIDLGGLAASLDSLEGYENTQVSPISLVTSFYSKISLLANHRNADRRSHKKPSPLADAQEGEGERVKSLAGNRIWNKRNFFADVSKKTRGKPLAGNSSAAFFWKIWWIRGAWGPVRLGFLIELHAAGTF
jgi:hypothetical protein